MLPNFALCFECEGGGGLVAGVTEISFRAVLLDVVLLVQGLVTGKWPLDVKDWKQPVSNDRSPPPPTQPPTQQLQQQHGCHCRETAKLRVTKRDDWTGWRRKYVDQK
jgi:hypothetical protein